jgi:predicted ATP-grasp superfamily ATP-dependent carboligase
VAGHGNNAENAVASGNNLLLFGASVRAAAYSAVRAGLRPWCADLFADADLCRLCHAMKLPGPYPEAFLHLIDTELPGPWAYTGGLENRVLLVRAMARRRPLWGNDFFALMAARFPDSVARIARAAGLPTPDLRWLGDEPPMEGTWLLKPLAGSGGVGIRFWRRAKTVAPAWRPRFYLQEYLEGTSCAAVWASDLRAVHLLGVTRQLVGEVWLHARPFQYCGSIGPVIPEPAVQQQLLAFGIALRAKAGLRGLFGVDGILREGTFWPVEVNPRYPASIEVLEHATGLRAMAWHRHAFEPGPLPALPTACGTCVGKAILFARQVLTFPADGPWVPVLVGDPVVEEMVPFADLPRAGERIEAGRPILTFFTRADSATACEANLRDVARDLDRWLGQA